MNIDLNKKEQEPVEKPVKTDAQLQQEIFLNSLEEKVKKLNETSKANPPKNSNDEEALISSCNFTNKELVHLLAVNIGRVKYINNSIVQILNNS